MGVLSSLASENKQTLEWLKVYSQLDLTNEQKYDMLENYFTEFNIPTNNQKELVTSGHTLIGEQPLYSLFELYCKAMGLQVEYIKLGQKESLFLRVPKGFLNEKT